jgi:CO/xanthine dehydrogenase Mo-binding subunit
MFYGIGSTGIPNPAEVHMTCRGDGTIQLCAGVTDGGQGAGTTLSQIAAESVGVSLKRIKFGRPDTDITPDSGTSTASRLTYVVGRAVYECGKALRDELMGYAAHFLKCSEEAVDFENDQFFTEDKARALPLDALIGRAIEEGFPLQSKGYFDPDTTHLDPDTGQGVPYGTYAFATQGALVKVDRQTGQATVLKVIAAHDVGCAINPSAVEAQIQGGVIMGLGLGIMECVHVEQGEMHNPDFQGYLIPSAMDLPEVQAIIIEDPEPSGPYGAKGVGEPALIPTAPAICNALAKATGCRFFETPVTPESIWAALNKGKG